MSIREYLNSYHKSIDRFDVYGFSDSINTIEEIRMSKQAIIHSTVVLVNGSTLHIKEYVDAKYKIEKVNYSYQFQDKDGNLIFRYDNARHRPNLGYENHKHLANGSIIQSGIPDIDDIVDEVISSL